MGFDDFIEASAKTNHKVEGIFEKAVSQVRSQLQDTELVLTQQAVEWKCSNNAIRLCTHIHISELRFIGIPMYLGLVKVLIQQMATVTIYLHIFEGGMFMVFMVSWSSTKFSSSQFLTESAKIDHNECKNHRFLSSLLYHNLITSYYITTTKSSSLLQILMGFLLQLTEMGQYILNRRYLRKYKSL